MRLFGLEITRQKANGTNLRPVTEGRGGWWPYVREAYTGAWQRNSQIDLTSVVSYSAVFSCVSLIASDISKIRLRLVKQDDNGIWSEFEAAAFSPILRNPNHYQNRIQFVMQWILSKLLFGNTYVLKVRDNRNVISEMYILDPTRVKPLIAPNGDVYYQVYKDLLSRQTEDSMTVPATEMIQDVMVPLYHPLVGVSPIYACGLAATQGLNIQNNSIKFFANNSAPGGILTAPGLINQETADRLKADWEVNYGGANFGKVAVLGDGLTYQPMMVNAADAQLIEQLKWSAETDCSCFHVPPYMIGVGSPPAYNNIEALNQQYYTQCLQFLIESVELCLDMGLELPKNYGTEFDISDLLRMDTATHVNALAVGTKAGIWSPNEARKRFDLKPVKGGDTPYLQQQNWSLAALSRRDEMQTPPTGIKPPKIPGIPVLPALPAPTPNPEQQTQADFANEVIKCLATVKELENV